MAITETIKNLLGKILTIGTPPEKEVLYKEVIKRKVPKESAEKLMIDDIKSSVKKVFSTPEGVEFARGTPNPPIKKVAKKKIPAKKTASKKSTTTTKKTSTIKKQTSTAAKKKTTAKTKATETKTTTAKKSTAKKTVNKKVTDKKTVAKKSPETKATVKKESTKKITTSTVKKTTPKSASTKKPTTKKPVSKKATETKSTTTTKKPAGKKVSTKGTATKTVTEKKTTAAPRGAKKAAKIALYIKDIKKHYGEVDEAFVAIIVKNLGPSIYKRDAELVSCSDPKELDTVRKNFLIKKLGIEASQGVLDAAIQDVCTELKGVRTKYRATFYYSLAKKFKKESVLK